MDRRDFLKVVGAAGIAIPASGLLSQLLSGKTFAEDAGGGPLIIRLKGNPREMGKQYAEQARDLIKDRIKRTHESGSKVTQEAIDWSRVFLSVQANSIIQEIDAMADKLDEKEDDVFTLSAEMPGVGMRVGGCTSMVLDKSMSKDNRVWLGQNVDDTAELDKYGVIIIRRPNEGPHTMTWALAGGMGGIGMSTAGLALMMNYVQTVSGRTPNALFPEHIAAAALRQKDFKDMMGVLTDTQVMAPVTFVACDKGGERVVVERTPLKFSAFTPAKNYAAYTNHMQDKDMTGDDTTEKAFPDSKKRLARVEALLGSKKGQAQPDFLKSILGDMEGKPESICRQASPPTIASIIMCPESRLMLATKGSPDRAKYAEHTLGDKD